MRQDTRVRDHRTSGVGVLQRVLDGVVEHGLVPARQLHGHGHAGRHPALREGHAGFEVDGKGLVVSAPQRHRWVMTEQTNGLDCLTDRLLAHPAGVPPLEGHVLPHEQPLPPRILFGY